MSRFLQYETFLTEPDHTTYSNYQMMDTGRVPFDQNFRKFRFEIEWKRKFQKIRSENFGPPLEVAPFTRNLEIPEISCSIWHFYPV